MLPKSYIELYLSVVNKLRSKEAYLGGGSHVALKVSWGLGQSAGLNGRVSGTRGSRGTLKKIVFF